MLDCPDLAVPREVMQHVVHVESSRNPYAIGVVGGYLARQPKNLEEALATVRQLKEEGYNFSVGIAQVNRYNLAKYGLKTYEQAFAVCPNLQAGSRILRECYDRAQDWGKAFSCYYSGNFATGFQHGYVQKIFASIQKAQSTQVAGADPIRVIPYNNAPRKRANPDDLPVRAPSTPAGGAASANPETEEARPAIPVPGPGAMPPQAGAGRGFAHIPTQVVGVNGYPYLTKILPPLGSTPSSAVLPLPAVPSELSSPSRRPVDTFNPRRGNGFVSKGGAIVQGADAAFAPNSKGTGSTPRGNALDGKNADSTGDRSFVF